MVITCSDTRTPDTDTSGQLIQKLLKEQGHTIAAYHLVKDEPAQIKARITEGTGNDQVQAIIVNGGTGISRRDSTFEAVDAMLEKRLDGFGEVFRYLTYQEIGSPAIISRATGTGIGSPTPAACDSTMFRWSCAKSASAIRTVASRPNPVLMPYTGS